MLNGRAESSRGGAPRERVACFALGAALAAASAGMAHAQPLDGAWTASTLQIRNEVRSWGADCGPRPPATATEPGGSVQLATAGDHFRAQGALVGRTDACWSENREVHRVSTSAGANRWMTICATVTDNPRAERGRYTWTTDGQGRLAFEEVTEYDWQLRDSRCVATRRATRTLTRVRAEGLAVPPPPPPTLPELPEPACTPGAAHHLRVRPPSARIQPGERVCFRADVVDASNCPLAAQPRPTFDLRKPEGLDASLDGRCFVAAGSAAAAEGEFRVLVEASGQRAAAVVLVRSDDLSGLIAERERGEGSIDPNVDAEAGGVAGVAARTRRGGLPAVWTAVIAGLAVLLGGGIVIAFVVARRRASSVEAGLTADPAPTSGATTPVPSAVPTPKVAPVPSPAPPAAATARPPELACPVCGRAPKTPTRFCAHDGAELRPAEELAELRKQGMICPTCRRGYPPEARECTVDHEELVPYALFRTRPAEGPAAPAGKICPKCGERFAPNVTFCGKDGTPLEVVN